MGVAYSRRQRLRSASLALVGVALGTSALAQTPTDQPPPPAPADTTSDVEVPADVPQESESPPTDPAPPEPTSPEHVPPDASGFQLSTLETKNLSLLYIDPIQTYLTPYLGRSFENALAFHKKVFRWEPSTCRPLPAMTLMVWPFIRMTGPSPMSDQRSLSTLLV